MKKLPAHLGGWLADWLVDIKANSTSVRVELVESELYNIDNNVMHNNISYSYKNRLIAFSFIVWK